MPTSVPYAPAEDYDPENPGSLFHPSADIQNNVPNPVAVMELYKGASKNNAWRALGNIYGEIRFLKDFTFRATGYMDLSIRNNSTYTPKYDVNNSTSHSAHRTTMTSFSRQNDETRTFQADLLLSYKKVLALEKELKERMRLAVGRQELLDAIVSEIESQKQELGERYPNKLYYRLMRIVEDGRTQTGKMLSFENYFVEVHYDFMQRMQKLHPDLSPSELKFSCLVRANLTTKEMASILGIDIRSVELKKYRLKRKLGLDKDSRLTSFILNVCM